MNAGRLVRGGIGFNLFCLVHSADYSKLSRYLIDLKFFMPGVPASNRLIFKGAIPRTDIPTPTL